MTPPTLHPERRHCLGCRHLQPVAGVLDCVELVSWRGGTPPAAPCKAPARPMLRLAGKPPGEG